MALSAFDDKSRPPQQDELASMLGPTFPLWNELAGLIAAQFPPLTIDWGFTSKNTGWGVRLRHADKRTVLYMTPCQGYFLASFALGEKAVEATHESDLPQATLDVIDGAKRYAEGRGVRLEIHSAEDVRNVVMLASIKMAN